MVKNKKAVSAMIGYILLVSFGIVMSVIVFNYLQTYVPKDLGGCPSGTSMILKDYSYDPGSGQLNLTIKNNGKFNVAGFFIHAANETGVEIATIDLSKSVKDENGTKLYGNAIVANLGEENLIKPNKENNYIFNTYGAYGELKIIDITPMRFQEENGRTRPITCSESKSREILG